MDNINVLVTGIGGPIAQGIMKGLREREDITIIGVDRREITGGHQFCDRTYQIPQYTKLEDYREAILNIVERDNIEIIFPSLHEEVGIYHHFKNQLNAMVALPESDYFDVLLNKEKTYQFLTENSMDEFVPRYHGFNTSEELHHIKRTYFSSNTCLVSKVVEGYASLGFAILTDRENYLKALKEGKSKIVNIEDYSSIIDPNERKMAMEYLGGMEFSIDVFIDNSKVVTAVPREGTGVSNGIVLEGKVKRNEALIDASSKITEALVTNGFINVQFIETDDGYKLTDVNPRFCGSQVMSLGANVNFPSLYIEYNLLNNPIAVSPKWNTKVIRFRDQLFIHDN